MIEEKYFEYFRKQKIVSKEITIIVSILQHYKMYYNIM